MKNMYSEIFIAGSGPGDVGLVTLKLKEVLAIADVVLCDNLVNRQVLDFCKPGVEIIDVGKSGRADDVHKFKQKDINDLLLKYAYTGQVVVRLKGGDPFVLGRGSEECEILAAANIPYEVIPGISSSMAGPMYAGIPVTHRELSRSFAVATGHLMEGEDSNNIQIPRADTIIFLMGIKNLPMLVAKLIKDGHAPATSCALIENATTAKQRTYISTLDNVCQTQQTNKVEPPALFVVGSVTLLREKLKWVERKPLFGKTILLTRARHQITSMANKIRKLGAEVIECPAIEISPIESGLRLIKNVEYLKPYTDIIFTSVNGVEIFFDTLSKSGQDCRVLGGKTVIAIGKMTASVLLDKGIKADIIPDVFQAEGILDKLGVNLIGRTFLLPRAKGAREILITEIKLRGGLIEELLIYESLPSKELVSLQESISYDGICFTSSSTVDNFCQANKGFRNTPVFSIGEITTNSAVQAGFTNIHTADEATIDSVIEKIVEIIGHNNSNLAQVKLDTITNYELRITN